MADVDEKISQFMTNVLRHYDEIRGKNRQTCNFPFWDAVVFSASDESQKIAYEVQISQKKNRQELPLGIEYHVFADPPECKIGCGGSMMFVLEKLSEIYGTLLPQMRLLFVPAGGYSQRLPNLSVLGKLFCPLPFGSPMYQMIDLILAAYLPFLKNMDPGVFLASSDAIISYDMNENDKWTFQNTGFTALAHPSSISVGSQHGVYVLPYQNYKESNCYMSHCIQVLQKPTEAKMHEAGAIVENYVHPGGDQSGNIVFSDSAFFFDSHIISKLIKFYKEVKPIHFEISSYADFLQPLGIKSNSSYIKDSNTELVSIRMKLYELLKGTPLNVLVLRYSQFHHLGTMPEYIQNLRHDGKFLKHFQCTQRVLTRKLPLLSNIKGTVMCSIIHPKSVVYSPSIMEYCSFDVPVTCGKNCILSNCRLRAFGKVPLPVVIPSNVLLHTAAVSSGYVTVAFGVNDDLKKCCKFSEAHHISFLDTNLKDFIQSYYKQCLQLESDSQVSAWNVKLFPVCETMDESFRKTLKIITPMIDSSVDEVSTVVGNKQQVFMSMEDVLKFKDIKKMLEYQKDFL